MRGLLILLLSLICLATPVLAQPVAAEQPLPDIRQRGFVYCVSGILNTFNPQMASSGLTVDTLAAQLYDRLLDVDPYTYRLIPELRKVGKFWITAQPTVFIYVKMCHFRLPTGLRLRG